MSADRNSLLAEIRSLHKQLHSCTLQSQEQLRELQSSLNVVREEGVQTQQQLHRQGDYNHLPFKKKKKRLCSSMAPV